MIHPAVSPVFANNPGFRLYTIEDDVQDYTDYSYNLYNNTNWREEVTFSSLFNRTDFNYREIFDEMNKDSDLLY